MNNTRILWILVVVNLLVTLALGVSVWNGNAIEHWVQKNPQLVFDTVNNHLQGNSEQAQKDAQSKIEDHKDFLYNDARHPFLGNRNGDVTVIEFMDYNCGYCKRAYDVISQVLAEDSNLRVVLIEIPILHETSALAAKWALAAHQLGDYAAFHKSIMHHKGQIDEAVLTKFAKDAGLDPAKVKEIANAPEINALVAENLQKANAIGISGTPGFIIGEQVFRGYIEAPVMKAAIEEARQKK